MPQTAIATLATPVSLNLPIPAQRAAAKPFIKWAGGKGQLISKFVPLFPPVSKVKRYFEPFLGGAALFFYLQHPQAYLSDGNAELIELYQIVRDDVDHLIEALKLHRNTEDYYYQTRALNPVSLTPIQRAARFIFLNKTCYNGLYRVNSQGQFNVPFGRYQNPAICDAPGLRAASRALNHAQLTVTDFEQAVSAARRHDFIYFDPPYQPISKTSSFTAYTSGRFDAAEQQRLAQVYARLAQRGCYVMLSNSDAPLIRELYAGFRTTEILASRAINSKGDGRGKITELLITNY